MPDLANDIDRWTNPDPPESFTHECFPPFGLRRLLPHHIVWWTLPPRQKTHWCCCCCHARSVTDTARCTIDLQLAPNVFGPGKSLHLVGGPGVYYAEFYLEWVASGKGQITVDLELITGPVATPQRLADKRGPHDRYLFSTSQPGTYLFRAVATNADDTTCFDTL